MTRASQAFPFCDDPELPIKIVHRAILTPYLCTVFFRQVGEFPAKRVVRKWQGVLTPKTILLVVDLDKDLSVLLQRQGGKFSNIGYLDRNLQGYEKWDLETLTGNEFSFFLTKFSLRSLELVCENLYATISKHEWASHTPLKIWFIEYGHLLTVYRLFTNDLKIFKEAMQIAETIEEFVALAALS